GSPAADFINTEVPMAESNSNLVEPGLAISSRRFSAAAEADRLSAGSADVRRQPNAGAMSKRTSWSRSKKRSTDRQGRFRYAAPVRTKWKTIRSKFRAASMKASASGWPGKANRDRAAGKAAIYFCESVWRDIPISRLKEAISFTK